MVHLESDLHGAGDDKLPRKDCVIIAHPRRSGIQHLLNDGKCVITELPYEGFHLRKFPYQPYFRGFQGIEDAGSCVSFFRVIEIIHNQVG